MPSFAADPARAAWLRARNGKSSSESKNRGQRVKVANNDPEEAFWT